MHKESKVPVAVENPSSPEGMVGLFFRICTYLLLSRNYLGQFIGISARMYVEGLPFDNETLTSHNVTETMPIQ